MLTMLATHEAGPLVITEAEIRRNGPGNVLGVCWRQRRAERRLARRGVCFRTTDPAALEAGYSAMTADEFDAINGRQEWANWRTIARSLSGLVPNRPLRMIDLGCGTGGSTRVLAFYAPAGSRIIGYELARPLVNIARRRDYRHRSGQPAAVAFVCQGVTEPFRAADGGPLPEQSIDVANASGIVGHHLDPRRAGEVAAELRRILVPGGLALLDPGPSLPDDQLSAILHGHGFTRLRHRRSCLLDPYGQTAFRIR